MTWQYTNQPVVSGLGLARRVQRKALGELCVQRSVPSLVSCAVKELQAEMEADGIPDAPHTDDPVVAPTDVQLDLKQPNGQSNGDAKANVADDANGTSAHGAPLPLEVDRPTGYSGTAPWDMGTDSETEQEEEETEVTCCSGG